MRRKEVGKGFVSFTSWGRVSSGQGRVRRGYCQGEGEDMDKDQVLWSPHAGCSPSSESGCCSGVERPYPRADTPLLFKMELVPGSLEPVKTAMNFAKQL